MSELYHVVRAHAGLLWITTIAAYSQLHYMVHGTPAHLFVLPGLAVSLFLAAPLASVVWLDARDVGARVMAAIGAAAAYAPALYWAYGEGAKASLKADPAPLVVGAGVGLALAVIAMAKAGLRPADWGLGMGDRRFWGKPVLGLLLLIAVGMPIVVALVPSFAEFYPRYKPARADVMALLAYQLAIGLYMFCWEFFFRGYLLFGVGRSLGPAAAIVIQAVPFFLLHVGKPEAELIASWFGGLLMGALCWRARSMWPSFLLHWSLYASVEIWAFVARRGGLG